MKKVALLLCIAGSLTGNTPSQAGPQSPEDSTVLPVYLDTSLAFETRAADLVSRMTLDEKISQMQNDAPAIPRLGVQKYNWWNECLHGVARAGIATVFPQAIGMAATWDPDLIHQEADIISTEARAKYNDAISKGIHEIYHGLTFWSPNINIFRDPRWGRGQETYGEDPFLTSQIGISFVKGLQGDDPKYFKVISTAKHFAVHSGPEPERHRFDAMPIRRDLYETYLPAFEACIQKGGAYSVMGAYNSLYGVPCCADSLLLIDNLRNEWGFKGYVVSDCGAIWDIYHGHKYAHDAAEASAFAVKAGCDLTCGEEYSSLKEALARGLITEGEIDKSVTRLMLARFQLGMFDPPDAVPYSKIPISDNDTEIHRQLARKVADESIVLLKNKCLPLKKNLKSVAVIGTYADDIDILLGNYNGTPSNPVTILDGIKNKLGKNVPVKFAAGYNLLEDTNKIEVVEKQYLKPAGGLAGRGLYAEYFDNWDLNGRPVLTKIDSDMAQYWGLGSPGDGIPKDFWSMRWTGTITPPSTGKYEIGIITDDRGKIYLGDSLLVDNWEPFQVNVYKSRVVSLVKGVEYKIEIDYADSVEYAGIKFMWRRVYEKLDGKGSIAAERLTADAVNLAKRSDAVIVVAGISPQLEGEEMKVNFPGFEGGDRTRLSLPDGQENLLKALNATGKKIVLVLVGGSALSVNWEEKNLPAIIDAWYPGEAGGDAVADVVFGDYNPGGRLPVTFYKSVTDLPPFEDYDMSADSLGRGRTYRYFRGVPLYPFGFGLSYTKFEYSKLRVSKETLRSTDTLKVSVTVQNIGKLDGDEVVQLYVRNLSSKEPQPIKSLKGFKRVHVKNSASEDVEIFLPIESLRYFDEKKNGYVVEPGKYELQIGSSSNDIKLKKVIEVE
ncbi:MAG TPA: glycoside hydrolase family 3 C-terminal domain-containing protein [Candidatus Acidoferrales bacterium]|nr:glycoside hydrolase family 3 C-terminal domain-containing protein [Candidatus Acidoferrales bacterium]